MEATGLYCHTLTEQFSLRAAAIWIENSVQIKRSMGIARGKNDKIDAIRIAQYAAKNIDRIRLWKPMREVHSSVTISPGISMTIYLFSNIFSARTLTGRALRNRTITLNIQR